MAESKEEIEKRIVFRALGGQAFAKACPEPLFTEEDVDRIIKVVLSRIGDEQAKNDAID